MTRRSNYENPLAGPLLLLLSLAIAVACYKLFDSQNWPDALGKVVETRIYRDSVDDHDTGYRGHHYGVVVKYLYLVGQTSYIAEDTVKTFDNELKADEYLKSQYWKGQKVRVLFNPAFPSISTLRRAPI